MAELITLDQLKDVATRIDEVYARKTALDDYAKAEDLEALEDIVDGLELGEVNVIETVKVNGSALSVSSKAVDILIKTGTNKGCLLVNGSNVSVYGLGDMAYQSSIDYADLGEDLQDTIDSIGTIDSRVTVLETKWDSLTSGSGGETNIIEIVKVNGTALTVTDKAVDILIEEGETDGTISVNGEDVAVTGLGDLAYLDDLSTTSGSTTTALKNGVTAYYYSDVYTADIYAANWSEGDYGLNIRLRGANGANFLRIGCYNDGWSTAYIANFGLNPSDIEQRNIFYSTSYFSGAVTMNGTLTTESTVYVGGALWLPNSTALKGYTSDGSTGINLIYASTSDVVTVGSTSYDTVINGASITLAGATTVSSALTVSGAVTLNSTLAVSGKTTLTGAVTTGSAIYSGGQIYLSNNYGKGIVGYNFDEDGTASLVYISNADIVHFGDDNYATKIHGTTITFDSDITIDGDLEIDGTVTSTAVVTEGVLSDGATFTSASVTGALTAGTLEVNSTLTAGETTLESLTVSGTSALTGAVTASSTLTVSGATTLKSTLTVSGDTTVKDISTDTITLGYGESVLFETSASGTSTTSALYYTASTLYVGATSKKTVIRGSSFRVDADISSLGAGIFYVEDDDGNTIGGFGQIQGSASDGSTTYGVGLYYEAQEDPEEDGEIVVTGGGARAQSGDYSFYVTRGGTFATTATTVDLGADGATVYLGGSTYSSSDLRLKQDISPLDSVKLLDRLKPVTYRWKKNPGKLHAGFIAQDVMNTVSELGVEDMITSTDDEGYYTIDYNSLIPVLVNGYQALKHRVEQLEAKL